MRGMSTGNLRISKNQFNTGSDTQVKYKSKKIQCLKGAIK